MKKLLSLLLVLVMIFSLAACGTNKTAFTVITTGKKTVGEALVEEGPVAFTI